MQQLTKLSVSFKGDVLSLFSSFLLLTLVNVAGLTCNMLVFRFTVCCSFKASTSSVDDVIRLFNRNQLGSKNIHYYSHLSTVGRILQMGFG